jgi:hypothetical protein
MEHHDHHEHEHITAPACEKPLPWYKKFRPLEWIGLVAIAAIILNAFFDIRISVVRRPRLEKLLAQQKTTNQSPTTAQDTSPSDADLESAVLPASGIILPVAWNDVGKRMVETGVIDLAKFEEIYASRGGLGAEKRLLTETVTDPITMTPENSGALLNMLWAFGLGQKSEVLTKGQMVDPQYGGAENFASTGGWTLAKGDAMKHYAKHEFVKLTADQEALVKRVAESIYRPCCGNSVAFPDCNHGMAMLGLLELMAANGVSEEEMYKTALVVNSYWFPDTYLTIAKLKSKEGTNWASVDPKEVLGEAFSSAVGYRKVRAQVEPAQSKGGGGCGV